MTPQLILSVIDSLFVLQGSGVAPDASALARRLGTSCSAVGRTLIHLEHRGLVDVSTARLTMQGLAVAAALRAARPAGLRRAA